HRFGLVGGEEPCRPKGTGESPEMADRSGEQRRVPFAKLALREPGPVVLKAGHDALPIPASPPAILVQMDSRFVERRVPAPELPASRGMDATLVPFHGSGVEIELQEIAVGDPIQNLPPGPLLSQPDRVVIDSAMGQGALP